MTNVKNSILVCLGLLFVGYSQADEPVSPPTPADSGTYLRTVVGQLVRGWPTNRIVNVVCHGHSVPAGYARAPEVRMLDAYPNRLHEGLCRRYPHAVVNVIISAIGGEQSEQGAARFERDVLSLRPDVVTIDYSLNDRSIGLDRAEKAWRKMIELALSQQVKILLMTPTPDMKANLADLGDPLNQHARQVRELAAEYDVGLVDSLKLFDAKTENGGLPGELMAVHHHPNSKGHAIVAAGLLEWFPE